MIFYFYSNKKNMLYLKENKISTPKNNKDNYRGVSIKRGYIKS